MKSFIAGLFASVIFMFICATAAGLDALSAHEAWVLSLVGAALFAGLSVVRP